MAGADGTAAAGDGSAARSDGATAAGDGPVEWGDGVGAAVGDHGHPSTGADTIGGAAFACQAIAGGATAGAALPTVDGCPCAAAPADTPAAASDAPGATMDAPGASIAAAGVDRVIA